MPLLHISLTSRREQIRIDSELVAQHLTLIKASATYLHLANNQIGGLKVRLPFISPIDHISSDNLRAVSIPMNFGESGAAGSVMTQMVDLGFQFATEHLPKSFIVEIDNLDGSPATFGSSNGNLKRVDLFFNYETISRHL